MKSHGHFTSITSVLMSTIILAACSSDSTKTSATTDNMISFEPCHDMPAMQCGAFEVPLIHDSTDSRTVSIEVARLPARGDGPNEPLLLNLDSPGSGIDVLQDLVESESIPAAILDRYDIIGINQRGSVGEAQVDCDPASSENTQAYPVDQQAITTLVSDSIIAADTCSARYGDQLQWLGSNSVVQDLEVLRAKLNAPKLNFISGSFGTRVSALYLQRFPDSTGRMVLDAPLPPVASIESLQIDTAQAKQMSFEQMLSACGTQLPECDRSVIEDVFVARVRTLLENAEQENFTAFFTLLSLAVEEPDIGDLLAPLLIDFATNGDPAEMLSLIEELDLDNTDEESGLTLDTAILCADDAARPDVASLKRQLDTLNESSDVFAEALLPMAAQCVAWPDAIQPLTNIRADNAPVSLVIGGTSDVNTPITWAVEMADAVGGLFLSSNHQGHTTVFTRENPCVESILLDYLLEGNLPDVGTKCN